MTTFLSGSKHRWLVLPVDCFAMASVFFILLLFIKLEPYLTSTPGINVNLPELDVGETGPGLEGPVLLVDREGGLYFRHQVLNEDQLFAALRDLSQRTVFPSRLLIQADRALTLDQLSRIYALCRKAGITEVKLQIRLTSSFPPHTGTGAVPGRGSLP